MDEGMMDGAVYVQANEPENRLLAFSRADDGSLTRLGETPTGGAGDGKPHLTSQCSVVLTSDGRHLLVTNVASDDVSVFRITRMGPELIQRVGNGGSAPKSGAQRGGLVFVLNT